MAKSKEIANKPKNKGGNPAWVKGKSGNPKGRPKDGESWAAVIKEVQNMTPEQIAQLVGSNNQLGKSFLQLPHKVQMKYLVTARIMAQLMFEPNSSLWNSLMERVEGKVPQKIEGPGDDGEIELVVRYADDNKPPKAA